MLILSLSCIGLLVASSDASDRRVVQRIAHRGYDELLDHLAGHQGPLRGWLTPTELALQMCNQFEDTRVALSALVHAGHYESPRFALHSITRYSHEWRELFTSIPMTAIIAWARRNIDMTLAKRMVTILQDYTGRLNTECGFRFLPPTLQRSGGVFGSINPPEFRIITDGLTEGQLAHFPDSIDADIFSPITATFGTVTRGNRSWYYDIERKCTVESADERAVVIPELRVAVALPRDMTVLNPGSFIYVFFPQGDVRVPVGEILGITRPVQVVDIAIEKLRMDGDDEHFMFHVTLDDGNSEFSQIIIFNIYETSNFASHPINQRRVKFMVDGGVAVIQSFATDDVDLVPDAYFEAYYPQPMLRRLVKSGQYLIDSTLDRVIEAFRDHIVPAPSEHDLETFRESDDFSYEQKELFEVYKCVHSADPRSHECQDAIADVLTGEPYSYREISKLIDRVFA